MFVNLVKLQDTFINGRPTLVLSIEYSVCFHIKIRSTTKSTKNLCSVAFDEWFIYMLVVSLFFCKRPQNQCQFICEKPFNFLFAGEMIDKLTLTFNRTRQAVITRELIEIISGAAAL